MALKALTVICQANQVAALVRFYYPSGIEFLGFTGSCAGLWDMTNIAKKYNTLILGFVLE